MLNRTYKRRTDKRKTYKEEYIKKGKG